MPAENQKAKESTSLEGLPEVNVVPAQLRKNILALPQRMPTPREKFKAIQRWMGTVLFVEGDSFDALLNDLDSTAPEESATFSFEEVHEEDHDLIGVGAVFYWYIGYRTTISGQRELAAKLRFRRLPGWTRKELERVKKEARELEAIFGKRSSATNGSSI